MNGKQTPLGRSPAHRSEAGEETARFIAETFRLHRELLRASENLAAEFGLTSARWRVLAAFRDKALTVSSVARRLGLARQSVQRTTRCLEADGFVVFSGNPDHKRADLAGLTEKGETMLKEMAARQGDWLEALSTELPPSNLRIGVGMMRGLINRLSEGSE
ncbi:MULTISPECIES: MarR family winged helix-turn-helix transcriptional regulator [unclassified Pseudodesulfovibrio]|uniref:MarR family winged helix-turn-helix transcriptional regulator n=1 Tax=unclassified Pseudodesulfovibrio TaxID=2661612 RepID=UPI0013E3CB15|nr:MULTISPECIES: MarR family winged helix-turn-helix transcriptional regulator [unclassified Pseudodesulfovibrio]MCJ2165118.1 MarR family winged helix-turn-helix transcriptional regulator [Pseudodesulfovibrio sp. S3-i]